MDLKSGKHGTRVRGKKDILTKVTKDSVMVSGAYKPVVSNISSRTTNTPANNRCYDSTTLLFHCKDTMKAQGLKFVCLFF